MKLKHASFLVPLIFSIACSGTQLSGSQQPDNQTQKAETQESEDVKGAEAQTEQPSVKPKEKVDCPNNVNSAVLPTIQTIVQTLPTATPTPYQTPCQPAVLQPQVPQPHPNVQPPVQAPKPAQNVCEPNATRCGANFTKEKCNVSGSGWDFVEANNVGCGYKPPESTIFFALAQENQSCAAACQQQGGTCSESTMSKMYGSSLNEANIPGHSGLFSAGHAAFTQASGSNCGNGNGTHSNSSLKGWSAQIVRTSLQHCPRYIYLYFQNTPATCNDVAPLLSRVDNMSHFISLEGSPRQFCGCSK